MAGSASLYTWYHQHKKKDLGVGRKNWLQLLQEQENDIQKKTCTKLCDEFENNKCRTTESQVKDKNEQDLDELNKKQELQHENSTDDPRSFSSAKFEWTSHQKEKQDEDCIQPCSQSQDNEGVSFPSQEAPPTPASSLLNTTLNSPTFSLPEGNNNNTVVKDNHHTLSSYSPILPPCEAFPRPKRESSPRESILESLAGNMDGSEVSWSSVLATPISTRHAHVLDCVSPSTIERQTLHPRQRLRENVLGRSLFSPQIYGAANSSPKGEVSPGLGIINCISPFPKFRRRSVSLTDINDENTKPGWLEAATQGFRTNLSFEEKVSKRAVTPEQDEEASSSKPPLEDSECIPNPKVTLSQDCSTERLDHTNTPVQVKPVKARHLAFNSHLSQNTDFTKAAPLTQGTDGKTDQEISSSPLEKNVTKVEGCDESENCESSDDSVKDPLDIICSPVAKVKRKRKNMRHIPHATLKTLKLEAHEQTVQSSAGHAEEEMNKKQLLPEALMDDVNGMYLNGCDNNNEHSQIKNKAIEETLYSNKIHSSREENEDLENIDSKEKPLNKQPNPTSESTSSQIDAQCQTKCSVMKTDPTSTTSLDGEKSCTSLTKTTFLSDNFGDDKHSEKIISDKIDHISESSPRQKRKGIDILSLHNKKKGFVYPSDIHQGYQELNVSFRESIGGDGKLYRTPLSDITSNNGLNNESMSETSVPANQSVTCTVPIGGTEDERRIGMPQRKGDTSVARNSTEEKGQLEGEVPVVKGSACNIPVTHYKAMEEEQIPADRRQQANPGSRDEDETSSKYLRESVASPHHEQVPTSHGTQKPPNDIQENRDIDRHERSLRKVPIAPETSFKSECTQMITDKECPSRDNMADNNKVQVKTDALSTLRDVEMSCVSTKCDPSGNALPASSTNNGGQRQNDLAKTELPDKSVEALTSQEQGKYAVTSSLNTQMFGDMFGDIDFSDTDLDELEERSDADNDKKTNPDKVRKAVHREGFDGTEFNFGNVKKESGFLGFKTGSGKQVTVSDRALQHARKIFEEQSHEEQNVGQQQVPSGKPFTLDNPNSFPAKGEPSHLTPVCDKATVFTNCTLSKPDSLIITNNLVSDSGNEMMLKSEKKSMNVVSEVNDTQDFIQTGLGKNITKENNNRANGNDEPCRDSLVQTSTSDLSIQSPQLQAKNKDTGFQDNATAECSNLEIDKWMQPEETNHEPPLRPKGGAFQGFTTAAGSRVRVSKEALKKAQLLLEEEKDDTNKQTFVKTVNKKSECNILAEDKPIEVNELKVTAGLNTTMKRKIRERPSIGFHTATGKKVSVSDASITHARLLWKGTDDSHMTENDQETLQEEQKSHMNDETSKVINLQINNRDLNPSVKRYSAQSSHHAEEEFAAYSDQGNMSTSVRKDAHDETTTTPELRNEDKMKVSDTDSSTANERIVAPFCGFSTCNGRQVKVNNKSLQQARQLFQECTDIEENPENINKTTFETENITNINKYRDIVTPELPPVTSDENSGTTDQNNEVLCGSPILGSQKRNHKRKTIMRTNVTPRQRIKSASVTTQEICDISDVTEAFLNDCLLDSEDTSKEPSSCRKRLRGMCSSEEDDSLNSHKRRKTLGVQPI